MKTTLQLFFKITTGISVSIYCHRLFASTKASGFGMIAENINQPIQMLSQFIHVVCLIAGIGLLIGAAVRFKQNRRNPVQTPLSSCITLLIGGIAVLSVVFIPIPGS